MEVVAFSADVQKYVGPVLSAPAKNPEFMMDYKYRPVIIELLDCRFFGTGGALWVSGLDRWPCFEVNIGYVHE
jgi:hypothetical protein